jgi:tetratricopeptide (TPR) repeat protein
MKNFFLYSLLLISFSIFAQEKEKDKNLPKGNDAYNDKKFNEAEAEFRISEAKFKKKAKSSYNLGNSIYKQKQAAEAKYHFVKALAVAKTKTEKHKAFHNLGNCLMLEKDYQGAVEAYKNALRNNPSDEKTRYNYALAKKMLKENPPKASDDKNKDKDKKQKEDQKKKQDKNQDKNDNKDQKDQKDQDKDQNKGNNKPDPKEGENPQKQKSGINKQTLESMLDAVNNEEKKVQEKVNLQKVKGKPKQTEKDW